MLHLNSAWVTFCFPEAYGNAVHF